MKLQKPRKHAQTLFTSDPFLGGINEARNISGVQQRSWCFAVSGIDSECSSKAQIKKIRPYELGIAKAGTGIWKSWQNRSGADFPCEVSSAAPDLMQLH